MDAKLDESDVVEALERAGVEVEGRERVGERFGRILPARVLSVEDTGRVRWVKAKVGDVVKSVATTDTVREGEVLLWADLPPKEIGGRASEGMFLSAEELGLEGKSLHLARVEDEERYREEFLLDETVLQLYITPNRPDLLSVRGLAIEVSAMTGVPFVDLEIEEKSTLDETFPVEVQDDRCDLYTLRVIRLGKGETPKDIRFRLHLVGFNAINPAVDSTNWVAYLLGQPLHAFDSRKVKGKVVVRPSREGERFVSLEGKEYVLPGGIMLIADEEKPLAVAGVIGGEESGTYEDTEVVYLESAHFKPDAIRFASITLNVRTESSRRFERNVSPRLVFPGSLYAANLLKEWVGAEYGRPVAIGEVRRPRRVFVSFKKLRKYLGYIPEDLEDILHRLRFNVEGRTEEGIYVVEPEHRTDVSLQEDVIEEVARVIGYDNLPPYVPPETPLPPRPRDRYEDEIRVHLASLGAYEVISPGLFSPKELGENHSLRVISEFNESFSLLPGSPLPHILKPLSYNYRIGNQGVPLFSIVRLYDSRGGESRYVVFGITSPAQYYDAKFFLDSLLDRFGWDVAFTVPSEDPDLHPDLSAQITYGGEKVGEIGAVKHRIGKRFGLKARAYVWYVRILPGSEVRYERFSTLPSSVKDVSLVAPKEVPFYEVDRYVREVVRGLPVESVSLIDIYEGDPVPPDSRSYTYRFVIRPAHSPLSDEELRGVVEEITERIERKFSLRR